MLHLFSQRGGISAEALHGVSPGDLVVELEDGANGVVGEIVDVADLAHGDVLSVSLSRVGVATPPASPARAPEDESPGTQRKRARATRKSAARQEQQQQQQQQQRPPEPVQQAAPAEGVPPPSRAQADDDIEPEVQQRVIIRYAALFLESTLFLLSLIHI